MNAQKKKATATREEQGLGDNPLSSDDVMAESFYGRMPAAKKTEKTAKKREPKAQTRQPLAEGRSFRLVTFSFYEDDVVRLDKLLAEAKKKGHRKASRSQIVRLALRQVDLTALPDDI